MPAQCQNMVKLINWPKYKEGRLEPKQATTTKTGIQVELKVLVAGWVWVARNKIKNLSASEIEFKFNTQKYARNWRLFSAALLAWLSLCMSVCRSVALSWQQNDKSKRTDCNTTLLACVWGAWWGQSWVGHMSKYHLKVKQQALTAKDVPSRLGDGYGRDRWTAYSNFEYNSYAPWLYALPMPSRTHCTFLVVVVAVAVVWCAFARVEFQVFKYYYIP